MAIFVQWILEAWASLGKVTITSSFWICSLTAAADGLEDEQIHCFQERQPCHAGLERLKFAKETYLESRENDPFAAIEEALPESSLIDLSNIELIDRVK